MPIPFTCPHCGAETNVSEEYLGSSGPCAHCGQTITMPAAAATTPLGAPVQRSNMTPVIVIVVLLAVLGLFVVGGGAVVFFMAQRSYTNVRGKAQINATEAQIGLFKTPLDMYRLMVGGYPTTDQGLEALRERPAYLIDADPNDWPIMATAVPNDPWSNPYQYECPGRVNTDSYDLWSFGPDMVDGTNDDVGNW